jgi:hypothetical protein
LSVEDEIKELRDRVSKLEASKKDRIRVLEYVKRQPILFNPHSQCFHDLPDHETIALSSVLIAPGKPFVNVYMSAMSRYETEAIVYKIDAIYSDTVASRIVAESAWEIVSMVRLTKSSVENAYIQFGGILAQGTQLDIWPLRAKDVGGSNHDGLTPLLTGSPLYNSDFTPTSWSQLVMAGTPAHLIPPQITKPGCALIILGGMEHTSPPNIESIVFTLQGIPVGAQPTYMTEPIDEDPPGHPTSTEIQEPAAPIFRLEKPIIVTPQSLFTVDIMPKRNGFTDFELIAVMCGPIQDKRW